MNYLDLAFIIITALIVITGVQRGLLVSLLSMLRFFFGVPLAFFVSDRYYISVYDNFLKETVYNQVLEQISRSQSVNGIIKAVNDFTGSLPDIFSRGIDTSSFKDLSLEEISKEVTDSVVEPVALIVIKIILFIITFVLFYIVAGIIIHLVKKLRKKEHMPLRHANAFLGGVLGLLKALVLIFTVSTIIGYICGILPKDNSFVKLADSSYAVDFINANNPFIKQL